MLLSRTTFLNLLLILQIFINLFYILDIDPFMFRSISVFLFLLFVPGIYILTIVFKKAYINPEFIIYSLTLSIAFILGIGWITNVLFPLAQINNPLSLLPLGFSVNLGVFFLSLLALSRTKNTITMPVVSSLRPTDMVAIFLASALLMVSIIGAQILNNGGTNLFALSFIVACVLYVFFIVHVQKNIQEHVYPFIVFLLSLGLLLSYTLRSSYILGWDINEEFKMFQLTKNNAQWVVSSAKSIYNTCLSITILPTILHIFTGINDHYIFKILMQIIFAFVPVSFYLIVKRYMSPILAFLATFFFMAQQTFYLQLTAVVRQEVAFLFFAAMILVIFDKRLQSLPKNILYIIFSMALVVSHYSTTYITVVLFLSTYVMGMCFTFFNKHIFKNINYTFYHQKIKLYSLLFFIVFAVIWNTQTSSNYNQISNTTNSVLSNLGKIFTFESKSSTLISFLFNSQAKYTNEELNEYIEKISYKYIYEQKENTLTDGVTQNIAKQHFVEGIYPTSANTFSNRLILLPYSLSKYVVMLGLFIGFFIFTIKILRSRTSVDAEYYFFSGSILFLFVVMIIVPHLSVAYNLDRVFQQGLFFTAVLIIYGVSKIFFPFKKIFPYLLAGIFLIYYVYQSGITAPFTGDVMRANTFNYGPEYDAHYIHAEDVSGIWWLSQYRDRNVNIYSDRLTKIKFFSMGSPNIDTIPYIFPNVVEDNGYVYAGYTNTKRRIASIEDAIHKNNAFLYIDFPFSFYDDHKSLIYNNGGAKIYK